MREKHATACFSMQIKDSSRRNLRNGVAHSSQSETGPTTPLKLPVVGFKVPKAFEGR